MRWLTPAQIAAETPRSSRTVYRALACGELHGHQRNAHSRWIIQDGAVQTWLFGGNLLAQKRACGCLALAPPSS